jgi:lysyl-tRNA synthetase class II
MAKKLEKESPQEQAKRFAKQVQDMIDAGELNPTEADERFERAMGKIASPKTPIESG